MNDADLNRRVPSKRTAKVLVAGNAVLDITPVFPQGDRDSFREWIVPGRLITMNGVDIHAGGACCNTGAALKRLGVDVAVSARVGKDALADILKGLLKKTQIRADLIRTDGVGTSYTVVLAPPDTDRIFLHDPGAGDYFSASDIESALSEDIDLFHFGYPPLMKRMYERAGIELISMFQYVQSRGILTSLDMAMVAENTAAAAADWNAILGRLLPSVDFFLPSLEETCFFIDPDRYEAWKRRSCDGTGIPDDLSMSKDVAPLADRLLDYGTGVVIIKCGEYGMYYRTADKDRLAQTAERLGCEVDDIAELKGIVRAFRVDKVVSANGAGDAAIAGFLAGILRGHSLRESVLLGCAAGALSVRAYDAVSGLIPLDDMLARIRSGRLPGKESFT